MVERSFKNRDSPFRLGVFLVVAAFAVFGSSLQAATITKDDNEDDLKLATSWVGGNAPGPADIALWDNTVTGANTVSMGALVLNYSTIQINDPGGLVTINGAGTLALFAFGVGGVGIDMSAAKADLTINANIDIADTPPEHIWTVAAGRTLTVNGNVGEDGPADKALVIDGAGTTRINGVIGNGENDLSIVKNGTGMLALTAANEYGGTTTINQGVLRISNSGALGETGIGDVVTINAGGELQLLGNISLANGEDMLITGTGAGGPGSAAIRNISGANQLNGNIKLQDVMGVVRINSDSGNLALLGNVTEDGGSDKILAFGGRGDISVTGGIGGGTDILAVTKDGTGTLELTGNNSYKGTTVVTEGTLLIRGAIGDIGDSVGVTINNATLTLENTSIANKNDRIGNVPVTLNGGTFNFIHDAVAGADYSERIDKPLSLSSGASTIRTDVSNTADISQLRFKGLARSAGATVNFVGGTSGPSAANDDNNVVFDDQLAGFIGAWATVGGTNFATYSLTPNESVEALTIYEQTLTRLDSGIKVIADGGINNVVVTEGTGTVGDITLGAAITTINTLTNSATGGPVTIDPAGQTLAVNGILNAAGSGTLTIGNGTNNGTLTANTAGGELVIQNYSSNTVTVNSVIADNTSASSLTKAGTGSVIVTAANTYSGATYVNQGTLQVAGTAGALTNTSNVTVNTSGTLLLSSTTAAASGQINNAATVTLAGGTIRAGVNGINETVGALTLSVNSVIDFGTLTGSNNLRFGDSTGLWTAGTTLNILNYTDGADHLFFGIVTNAGVDTGQLGQINFFSDDSPGSFLGTAAYLVDGEVVPVPEPGTWIGGALTAAAVAFTQRRRLRKVIAFATR